MILTDDYHRARSSIPKSGDRWLNRVVPAAALEDLYVGYGYRRMYPKMSDWNALSPFQSISFKKTIMAFISYNFDNTHLRMDRASQARPS